MTTRDYLLRKATVDQLKFGRKGERSAFAEGLACSLGYEIRASYKTNGRCCWAFRKGAEWGTAILREEEVDKVLGI